MSPRSAAARADEPVTEPVVNIQPELARTMGRDLEASSKAVVVKFNDFRVTDNPSCSQAVLDRQDLGTRIKAVQEFFKPFKDMAYKLHKAICDREKDILKPLEIVDGRLRDAIQGYTAEQDRIRREEEQRQAQERQREKQDWLLREAANLEQSGEAELAQAVVDEAMSTPAPVVSLRDVRQQVEGLKTRRVWKWRYVNNDRERAMSMLPREYLTPDETRIGKVVGALKDTTKIPGIQVYYEDVPVR